MLILDVEMDFSVKAKQQKGELKARQINQITTSKPL